MPGAAAAAGVGELVERRDRDHPEHAPAAVAAADQRGVERHAADERLGAVDRIDDPLIARRARRGPRFLAQEGVRGKRAEQLAAEDRLCGAVGVGHRRGVGLHVHHEAGVAEPAERVSPREPGGGDRHVEPRGHVAAGGGAAHGRFGSSATSPLAAPLADSKNDMIRSIAAPITSHESARLKIGQSMTPGSVK